MKKCTYIEIIYAKYLLGMILVENLPNIAISALESGCDSPALRVLAGLQRDEVNDAINAIEDVFVELNVPKYSKKEAILSIAKNISMKIVDKEMTPYHGAKEIWEVALSTPQEHIHELDTFIYAASEWMERNTKERTILEDAIVEASIDIISAM